jgi:hypothetical protein
MNRGIPLGLNGAINSSMQPVRITTRSREPFFQGSVGERELLFASILDRRLDQSVFGGYADD